MARQVLPIVGAVVGAYFGNPQLGYAIGAIIGNAVDPQHIRGPRLREGPAQNFSEGGFRAVVYGTSWIWDCQVLEVGPIRRVTVEEQQGKGGGPVVETERGYQTFAIGLGEPVEALRMLRLDGKIVFDVRPGSTILAESTAFAERFRFYDGSETQLPDPDLEALPANGVGNTPYYRGTSYLVFPNYDVTDLAGRIPTIEVEVIKSGAVELSPVTLLTNARHYSGTPDALEVAGSTVGWAANTTIVALHPSGQYAVGSVALAPPGSATFQLRKFDTETGLWSSLAGPASPPARGPTDMRWSPDGRFLLIFSVDALIGSQDFWLYRFSNEVLTHIAVPTSEYPNAASDTGAWDDVGARVAVANANTGAVFGLYDFEDSGSLVNLRMAGGAPGGEQAWGMEFQPGAGSRYLAVETENYIAVYDVLDSPIRFCCSISADPGAGLMWTEGGQFLIGVGNSTGPDYVGVWEFDSTYLSEGLTFVGWAADQPASRPILATLNSGRNTLALSRDSFGDSAPTLYSVSDTSPPVLTMLPDPAVAAGAQLNGLSWRMEPEVAQYESTPIILADLIEDICDRCGISAAQLDLAELTDELAGITLGGPYDGAGAITLLMPAFFFDLFEADRQIHAPKRGAAVVTTLTVDDLVEEPDENTLRGQDIEYPRSLLVKYLDPEQNYAAPAATVQRNSPDIRVRGEAVAELPINLSRTEAFRVADRMLKVMWEDLNGEVTFSLPAGPFAWLTPTDCLGLSLRGALYRIRVEKVEASAGVLKVTARRDRQSAYTSVLTPVPLPPPTPPPPSLAGATQFVVLNIPGIIDADDGLLGVRVAVCGLDGYAWNGCAVRLSADGGATYTTVASITTRAQIGTLLDPLNAASPYYTDTTNVVRVLMLDDRELESITNAQFLSERNPAAIARSDGTAELIQFRDVVDDGDNEWSLSRLHRGQLNTSAAAHLAGAKFVMLDGTVFVPLPSALMGQALQLQFVSFGTSPELAPTYSFTWDPVHSQLEFPPANLTLSRSGDVVTALAVPRHRFGTEDNPIAASDWTGYLFTATDGVNSLTENTASVTPRAVFDCTGWASPITVTVAMTNRITGAGPSISEDIP